MTTGFGTCNLVLLVACLGEAESEAWLTLMEVL